MSESIPFRRVLVANRGEIAVRVMRTLREMGITPVAVYSDADRAALHVRSADIAVPIGPAPAAESYLRTDAILEACKRSGATAVHPGYGFLSENAGFARALDAAGIAFIGPPASAIEAMGSKTAARARMIEAGVPVVPGVNAGTLAELERAAKDIGYPVLLKAAAGGGGKGMRLVADPADLATSYERARSEAKKSFADETVYLEKALVGARHVEIQVLGDKHGHVVHLGERDCSVQRRHQKVVEETPTPAAHASRELVAKMGETAVRAAQAVGYYSAGTCEFLLSAEGKFYFLEMNTRLQVEHTITELVTGVDLVREMVRVAAGLPLSYRQEEIVARGHAIQCRIYAEDPAQGFLPSPGRIDTLRVPAGPGVRDDSGVYEGAEISAFYDPLVSKLCVWAATREQAIERMRRALGEYVVTGIATNVAFHLRLMDHPAFVSGQYDTGFLQNDGKSVLADPPLSADDARELAIAAAVASHVRAEARKADAARNAGPLDTSAAGAGAPSAWRLAQLARLR